MAQCFGHTAAPILVLLGGIVGAQIAPSADLATLPIAVQILGIASAAIPASLFMSRFGRRLGFLGSTALAIVAALLAAFAVSRHSFSLFALSSFSIGVYIAFMQQFRFAVAESVSADKVPRSLSIFMLAGIVSALLGPEVGKSFSNVEGLPLYAGSFIGLAALLSISFTILLLFYQNTRIEASTYSEAERPLPEIMRQPKLILAIAAAAIAYSVMALVMTATPLSMHQMDRISLDATTRVIQSHILAMYLPSFFSGFLITRFGALKTILAGFVLMLVCIGVGWNEPQFLHYLSALIFLGVGWNFLFLGGTTLLTQCYCPAERFKVQAVNDFLVFGLQGVGSLSAGVLIAAAGWGGVMAFGLPAILLLTPAIVLARSALTANTRL
ncbi:MAG: MFS transporter [Gammaproteobacteria bacterium]|nr:MFS transporter [Gammaproteobacteria bacterium]